MCIRDRNIGAIKPSSSGEIYLTDLVRLAAEQGAAISSTIVSEAIDLTGVNDRVQLAMVEAEQRKRICEVLMLSGVTIVDPNSVYIDSDVRVGQDTVLLPNTILAGTTRIGEDCQIGPNTTIRDSLVGNRCRITESAMEAATMEDGVDMGPFSHLRTGAYLES